MFDPREIVGTLIRHEVEFALIGGVAATLYGCPGQTFDLDILDADVPCHRQRLLEALRELETQWDESLTDSVLQRRPVFALNTWCGDLGIFSLIPGLGSYREAVAHIRWMELSRVKVPVLDLPALVQTKETAADPNPRKQAALAVKSG